MKPTTGKLCDEYAYAAECNMATLVGWLMRKRFPKNEIDRQKSICLRMLRICQEYAGEITWKRHGGLVSNYGRVEEVLEKAREKSLTLEAAMDEYSASARFKP